MCEVDAPQMLGKASLRCFFCDAEMPDYRKAIHQCVDGGTAMRASLQRICGAFEYIDLPRTITAKVLSISPAKGFVEGCRTLVLEDGYVVVVTAPWVEQWKPVVGGHFVRYRSTTGSFVAGDAPGENA